MNNRDDREPPAPLDYVRAKADAPGTPPKTSTLIRLSVPALIGCTLLAGILSVIAADPGNRLAGENYFLALVPVMLISLITSGSGSLRCSTRGNGGPASSI